MRCNLLRTLFQEDFRGIPGSSSYVSAVRFSADERLLGSKSQDGTVRLWRSDTWETVAVIPAPSTPSWWAPGLAFHPTLPVLATAGSEPHAQERERARLIHFDEWIIKPGDDIYLAIERGLEAARVQVCVGGRRAKLCQKMLNAENRV